MTLLEVIEVTKKEKPNSFSEKHQIRWINECESAIQNMLGIPINEWIKYTDKDLEREGDLEGDGSFTITKDSTELIVPPPYDPLYVFFLKAKMDYANEEYESYGNHQAQFQSFFDEFKVWAYKQGMVTAKNLPTNWKNVY